ncbi:MAG: phosphoribosylamine--glycine ligase [Candidatus Levyibacteriota bacterium]
MKKTIVVIDGGGRGSALVWKYSQSPHVDKIIAIPGNDMMQDLTEKKVAVYTHLKTTSIKEILEICKKENVDLVDVAQDNAVAAGLVDVLMENTITVVGPTKLAGELEWSKAYSQEFMRKHNIPSAAFQICHSEEEGIAFINAQKKSSWFIKADGLAEGKGALPAENNADAIEKIKEMSRFGSAGKTFLIEEWLKNADGSLGKEFSTFAISDGNTFQIIGSAQDHKRARNGDTGENTGGMGCSSPPLVLTDEIQSEVQSIFQKVFDGMRKEGRPYKGILYLGGILINNTLYVIEFNARWGDPEAEVIVPSITNDLYEIAMAVVHCSLHDIKIHTDGKARVVVAGCSKGYPSDYSAVKGKEIIGLEKVTYMDNVLLFGAGVKVENQKYLANGGRLFYIVGEGKDVIVAREKAYDAMKLVNIEGNNLHYRTDIGWRDIARLKRV